VNGNRHRQFPSNWSGSGAALGEGWLFRNSKLFRQCRRSRISGRGYQASWGQRLKHPKQLAKISEADDGFFDRHIAINLKGVFNGVREAAKRLRSGGRIISFSSGVVGLYQPTYGVYAATKGGVEAMTHVLANELRGRNITVNAVAPGPTATDLFWASR
jgi:NAD(P)-dependent dehydrogenase (short-subunit alcohol dehydrogenase family)